MGSEKEEDFIELEAPAPTGPVEAPIPAVEAVTSNTATAATAEADPAADHPEPSVSAVADTATAWTAIADAAADADAAETVPKPSASATAHRGPPVALFFTSTTTRRGVRASTLRLRRAGEGGAEREKKERGRERGPPYAIRPAAITRSQDDSPRLPEPTPQHPRDRLLVGRLRLCRSPRAVRLHRDGRIQLRRHRDLCRTRRGWLPPPGPPPHPVDRLRPL